MMLTLETVLANIAPAQFGFDLASLDYDTDDIIKLMLENDTLHVEEVEALATLIPNTEAGWEAVYDFLIREIKYRNDGSQKQHLRTPARMIADRRKGSDCKSWTHFITRLARAKGNNYEINFASYKRKSTRHNRWKIPHHVYPTVYLPNGKALHVDAVWGLTGGHFGGEKPFSHKITYTVQNRGLAVLSGVDTESVLDAIDEINRTIPDSVLDNNIVGMTEGELQRLLMAQRMRIGGQQAGDVATREKMFQAANVLSAGNIGMIGTVDRSLQPVVASFIRKAAQLREPAFKLPTIQIAQGGQRIGGIKDAAKKLGQKAKDVVENVADAFKKALEKLINALFKGQLQKAAPFFLFQFIKKGPGGQVGLRMNKQKNLLQFITKLTGAKEGNVMAALKNGIIQHMGAAPEKILNDRKAGIAGAEMGWVQAVLTALPAVVAAVGAVAKLFKKEPPSITAQDGSDLSLIDVSGGGSSADTREPAPSESSSYTSSEYEERPPSNSTDTAPAAMPDWLLPVGAVAAFLLLKN